MTSTNQLQQDDLPPAYDARDIQAWWNGLTPKQKDEFVKARQRLDDENKAKLENLRRFNRDPMQSSGSPTYIYIDNSSRIPSFDLSIYDYYTMYLFANNAGPLFAANIQLQTAIVHSLIHVGSKLVSSAIKILPHIIEGFSGAAHSVAHLAGSATHATGSAIDSVFKTGHSSGGGGGGSSDAAIFMIVIAAIFALLIAIATAVCFAGYALKRCFDSVKRMLRRPIEGLMTLGAVAGGTALGALKGAIVGAAIGSAIPVIGTGVGAVLGAVIGACVTAGLFAGFAKGLTKLATRIKIKLGFYGKEEDLISKANPADYQLTEKDRNAIAKEINAEVNVSTDAEITKRMAAIHKQREEISSERLLPGTDSAEKYDALKALLIEGVKTGKALKDTPFTVGRFNFVWKNEDNRYSEGFDSSVSDPVARVANAA